MYREYCCIIIINKEFYKRKTIVNVKRMIDIPLIDHVTFINLKLGTGTGPADVFKSVSAEAYQIID